MHSQEKERLIISLQDHVNNITNLRYGSYNLAEILTQKTKRFALKNFPCFLKESDSISFTESNGLNEWNESYRRLLTISQAMLDEAQQSEQPPVITPPPTRKSYNTAYAFLFVTTASILLWSFNTFIKWRWLTEHPKKIAIYLSLQAVILVIFALFFTKSKKARFIELLAIFVGLVMAIISLLY